MTAGTVVITGGIIAAVILLTIVTVLCCCRLQYYCCKGNRSEEGEEEEEPFTKSSSSPACQSISSSPPDHLPSPRPLSPPSLQSFPSPPSPLSILPPPEYISKQHLPTTKFYEPAAYSRFTPALPIRSYTFCPSCSGILPYYMPGEEGMRNGSARISYRGLKQQEVDLAMDMTSLDKLNLIHAVAMREVMTHHSFSTDV
ncbi:protein FAM163B [Trichomycterus rosablanca]|uniref:protein FAM163B n=1 Tax=Trichomycterus rosablanca TaxID=2290929 RepID=UPI002F35209F